MIRARSGAIEPTHRAVPSNLSGYFSFRGRTAAWWESKEEGIASALCGIVSLRYLEERSPSAQDPAGGAIYGYGVISVV